MEATPLVRAVVFDVGGVLLDWDPRHLYRRLIPDEAERERFLAEVCTMEWNLTLDAGRSFDEACDELAAQHPEHAELIHAWKRQDEMVGGEVPGMADVVRHLRSRGTPLYLLTNMPTHVFRERQAAYEVLQLFDGAVVSGEEGVVKPSPEIFAIVAHRFGLEPAATLFIDDSEVNVRAAESAGFQAHRFTGVGPLVDELRRRGLAEQRFGVRDGGDAPAARIGPDRA